MMTPTCRFDSFTKLELRDLADRLLEGDPIAVEWCVTFVEAETLGIGHGRARAKMARRLKHCRLSRHQGSRLVGAILDRLIEGSFSQQFKDQLRLAMKIDSDATFRAARECCESGTEYIGRYARWVLLHER